ncbi:unnamed protein product [Urochloa humidicola]
MSPGGDEDDAGDALTVEYRFCPGKVFHLIEQLALRGASGAGPLHRLRRPPRPPTVRQAGLPFLRLALQPDHHNRHRRAGGGGGVPVGQRRRRGPREAVTARDVHEVLGVPHGPRRWGSAAYAAAVRRALGLSPHERQVVTLAQVKKVLDELTAPRPLSSSGSRRPMTQPERDRFVVSFLVYVIGHLLAPPGLREHTNAEVFHALANPSVWSASSTGRATSCGSCSTAPERWRRFQVQDRALRVPPLPPGVLPGEIGLRAATA